jgi:hypothetical protein
MDYNAQVALRKSKRRAFLLGLAKGRRLPEGDRAALVAHVRHALSLLPLRDRHALVAESAINTDVEEMIRCVAMALGTAVVVSQRVPTLERALLAQKFFEFGRELLAKNNDDVGYETRH